jgi:hypothetical protein
MQNCPKVPIFEIERASKMAVLIHAHPEKKSINPLMAR